MKLIVGLGNPGPQYERTRHNVGWWIVEHLADVWRLDGWRRDGKALVARGTVDGVDVRLLKPRTYMNLSGAAIAPYLRRPLLSRRAPIDPTTDLLVVVDDVALPLGRYRLRASGSAGGHNGLKSVEKTVGGQEYARLRVGILPAAGERPPGDLAEFVLSDFGKREEEQVRALFPTFAEAAACWLHHGIVRAMNDFNRERTTT
ncbi:MAG TPA: aminoacyl-tRNA hydrolase [Gemmatimonadaceae bacterium]|nr:aminoacyl-tRNA hydrolase [Gemmatimonadaceae bacterium]